MSAPKHTPGPWKLWVSQDARPHAVFLRHALGSIEIPHWGYIGTSDAIVEEQFCNARLIAAAPDLLAELQNIANADPRKWDEETRDQFQQWAQNRARVAIAKAIGGEA
ncbi:MAG: hypothetical protein ACK5X3_11770, partial [Pseudomonadota bacterium]